MRQTRQRTSPSKIRRDGNSNACLAAGRLAYVGSAVKSKQSELCPCLATSSNCNGEVEDVGHQAIASHLLLLDFSSSFVRKIMETTLKLHIASPLCADRATASSSKDSLHCDVSSQELIAALYAIS